MKQKLENPKIQEYTQKTLAPSKGRHSTFKVSRGNLFISYLIEPFRSFFGLLEKIQSKENTMHMKYIVFKMFRDI